MWDLIGATVILWAMTIATWYFINETKKHKPKASIDDVKKINELTKRVSEMEEGLKKVRTINEEAKKILEESKKVITQSSIAATFVPRSKRAELGN